MPTASSTSAGGRSRTTNKTAHASSESKRRHVCRIEKQRRGRFCGIHIGTRVGLCVFGDRCLCLGRLLRSPRNWSRRLPNYILLVDGCAGGQQPLQARHHGRGKLVVCERRRACTAARSPFFAASCSSPPATRSATARQKKGRIAFIADATTHDPHRRATVALRCVCSVCNRRQHLPPRRA